MISGKMKLLSAVVSAAALLATPALASKAHKKMYRGPTDMPPEPNVPMAAMRSTDGQANTAAGTPTLTSAFS